MEHAIDLGSRREGDAKPIIFDLVACIATKQLLRPALADGIQVAELHSAADRRRGTDLSPGEGQSPVVPAAEKTPSWPLRAPSE